MPKQNTTQKSLRTNFIFYCIKSAMNVIFPLISFPYASRILDVEGIGKVQYCTSIISYVTLIAGLGISSYAIRESAKIKYDKIKFSQLILEIFSINVISTLIAYFLLFIGISVHLFDGYIPILLTCSLNTLCTTLSVEWIYQAQEEYVYISIRTILTQTIAIILMFIFVKNCSDTIAYSLVLVFASGGYCLINFFGALKYIDFHHKYILKPLKHIKNILIMFSTTIAASIYLNLDILMIRFFSSDYQVGLYSAATNINVALRGILNSISAVLMPRLSYYQSFEKKNAYESLLQKGFQFSIMLELPCAVGITCLSPELILLINGSNFLDASTACCILAFNMIFSVLDNVIYTQILIPGGNEHQGCKGTCLGAISNLILNTIAIPFYGIEGAAVASLLAEFIVFLYFINHIRKTLNIHLLFAESYKPFIASLSIIFSVILIKYYIKYFISRILLSIIIAPIFYFSFLIIFKYKLVTEELSHVKQIFLKTLKKYKER